MKNVQLMAGRVQVAEEDVEVLAMAGLPQLLTLDLHCELDECCRLPISFLLRCAAAAGLPQSETPKTIDYCELDDDGSFFTAQVTLEDLLVLSGLPQLETLDLHDCDLDNDSLYFLGAATQLRDLTISQNNKQVLVSISLEALIFSSHKQGCYPGNASAPPNNSSTLTYPKTAR